MQYGRSRGETVPCLFQFPEAACVPWLRALRLRSQQPAALGLLVIAPPSLSAASFLHVEWIVWAQPGSPGCSVSVSGLATLILPHHVKSPLPDPRCSGTAIFGAVVQPAAGPLPVSIVL